jgi:hypothetical protein
MHGLYYGNGTSALRPTGAEEGGSLAAGGLLLAKFVTKLHVTCRAAS